MTQPQAEPDAGFLTEILSDPDVMNQIMPLLNSLIDQRIQPVVTELQQVSQGVKLIAEGMLAQAQPQPQAQPQAQPPPAAFTQQPFPAQPMAPDPGGAPSPQGLDKFAHLAPLLMQYLSNQQQGQSTNLSNIAETLGAAAQIGSVMNRPMWDGMKMATDLMSLAGRAGIEPTTAASHLGDMINNASTNNGTQNPAV